MSQSSLPKEPRLKELVLWVTTDCNLRYRYCYASGEPLLNMDLIEQVVRYTQGLGIGYQLQTNATLIDDKVAANLKRLGVDVGVSLDGLPEVNDPLRPFADGQGSTVATIAGLEKLRVAGIGVGLTCVLSAENVAGLPGLVELASYLGNVEGIAFDLLRLIGRASEDSVRQADPTLAARSVSAALRRADELALMGGRRVRFREVEHMRYLLIIPPYCCLTCRGHWLCGGPCPAQTYAQQLAGEIKPTECYIKRVFIDYISDARKEMGSYASANQVSLSV